MTRRHSHPCGVRDVARDVSVTAIIPVHNGARFISRALASIDSQDRAVDHIVLVDDGSSDELERVLGELNFTGTYVRQARQGQGAALNRGLTACSTSHVAFLDHDDEWVHDKTAWQVAHVREANVPGVFGSVTNVYDGPGITVREDDMGPARVLGASLVSMSVFEKAGLFPVDRRIHEVIDWWSRASAVCEIEGWDRPALRRHIHGGNQTLLPEHRGRSDLIARVREHRRRHTHG